MLLNNRSHHFGNVYFRIVLYLFCYQLLCTHCGLLLTFRGFITLTRVNFTPQNSH